MKKSVLFVSIRGMKYCLITYGCQMNKSDSERLAAVLDKSGHKPAAEIKIADLIVLNACSVRQSAIDRIYGKINQIQKLKKKPKIILTGCLLETDKRKFEGKVDEIWDIVDFDLIPKYQPGEQAYVPIMTGCNNFCSYCVVPYTRGREKSRPVEKIIKEVKSLIKKGYKEIMLLGQNVNSYKSKQNSSSPQMRGGLRRGGDKKTPPPPAPSSTEEGRAQKVINFARLLKMISDLNGNFQISFLTSHPKDMSDELINIIANSEKVAKEIHLPVQSGDNTILKKMNRHYTVSHYKNLIKKIRRKIPNAKISTDVIVGFPGETKKQFQNTVKLFKEIKFDKAYIAKYSPRLGTAAAKLKDGVSQKEKKRRWRILEEIVKKKKPLS